MMYTMLTGYPPFAQNSGPNETIEKVREGKWKMPEGISYFAQDLLDKLLQKDPRQRITLEQVRLHPFMMNNDAANSISASGSGSFSRQASMPQVAATVTAGSIHNFSATSHHTPRMPIIQTSASTPYTPNLSTSSSSLKVIN
jgi:serine/threonine protein kinase